MIRAVIFDVDGVLVDSEGPTREAEKLAFKEFGVTLDDSDFEDVVGIGTETFMRMMLKRKSEDLPVKELIEKKWHHYRELKETIRPFPGARERIEMLKKAGYKVGLATSGYDEKLEVNLEVLGMSRDDFDTIVSGSDVARAKPDPEIYEVAVDNLWLPPNHCVIVEDSVFGIQSAKDSGCWCIAVTTSFAEEKLKEADRIVGSVEEIDETLIESLGQT